MNHESSSLDLFTDVLSTAINIYSINISSGVCINFILMSTLFFVISGLLPALIWSTWMNKSLFLYLKLELSLPRLGCSSCDPPANISWGFGFMALWCKAESEFVLYVSKGKTPVKLLPNPKCWQEISFCGIISIISINVLYAFIQPNMCASTQLCD